MKINQKTTFILAHISLFIVFFWFGFIKLIGLSPANELVDALRAITIPWWPFESFIVVLGLFEVFIGILFLLRKFDKLAITILIPHMLTTMLPLVMVPSLTWQAFLVPTLAGQYIIKNIIIVALALSVVVSKK
jgi:uncharacterized membrane protein YkgB